MSATPSNCLLGAGSRLRAWLVALILIPAPVWAAELETVPASEEAVVIHKVFDGVIQPVKQSTVSAQIVGRITEVNFDVDDFVEAGSVLVRFQDTQQRAQLAEAKAAFSEARARHRQARAEFDRVRDLFKRDSASQSQLDQAQANFEAAKAQLEAAQARVEVAQEQLDHTVVTAPYSGVVARRHVEQGETVRVGDPLMTGFALEPLRVEAQVPQGFIDTVRANKQATVMLAGDQRVTSTQVTIFPQADPASHTFRVRVRLPDTVSAVYPGMFVKVAFDLGERTRLLVPRRAVIHRSEVTAVYVVDGQGRVSMRQIRTGHQRGERVVVLAGLEPGEHVAMDPVKAGTALKAQWEGGHE